MAEEQDVLNRWRLVLGKYAANRISFGEGSIRYMDMEDVLDYLYSREYGEEQDIRQERGGNGEVGGRTITPSTRPTARWRIFRRFWTRRTPSASRSS